MRVPRSGPIRFEWDTCISEAMKESPKFHYRPSEWVRTKMPMFTGDQDDVTKSDPKTPKYVTVKLKDLMAVQYFINKPTMFYYVHLMREEKSVDFIRVAKFGKKWVVINGTHRVEAARYMGWTEIAAVWGWR